MSTSQWRRVRSWTMSLDFLPLHRGAFAQLRNPQQKYHPWRGGRTWVVFRRMEERATGGIKREDAIFSHCDRTRRCDRPLLMSRIPRGQQAGYYHVINRGTGRANIFIKLTTTNHLPSRRRISNIGREAGGYQKGGPNVTSFGKIACSACFCSRRGCWCDGSPSPRAGHYAEIVRAACE